MCSYFEKIKSYVADLNLKIVSEDPKEELIVIEDESKGIKNLILDCEDPILVIEQLIFRVNDSIKNDPESLLKILKMNRHLVHGAFVVDEDGQKLLYRDTLQLANLDFNELEGSINALSLGLAEFGATLLSFAKRS